MIRRLLPVLLALLPLAASVPTGAQTSAQTSALRGMDTNAPIDVDAARIEIEDNANRAIFTGDVVIRQARMTLNADRVTVNYLRSAGGDPEMQRLDARGNVRLTSPSERITGTTGIYDVRGRLITIAGNVVLDRGGSMLRGQRLVLNLASGLTSFDGRGPATQPGQTPGRVTGRFVVPQRSN